ncbi:helix-turn-helix domain-containing protein [Mesorhizobium sp. B2-3-2]|uniref:helix-turn-helix domain-containing protein n=1 Tax=Mesorhizobium sp. B2-3-2 TaxID=2589961 RepID=UPI00112E61C4|nr:helix-turn-helix domain-containing protein [Mesorhizobium sp. B2-3-2]TPM37029.1 helix-turn-helix domain-containing protein [Mesorhizobium sp. B2-3-2]
MAIDHPLVEFSKRTGKSITAIAKDAGCSRMTLYRVMSGDNTTRDQLQRISAATDGEVKVTDLLTEARAVPAQENAV